MDKCGCTIIDAKGSFDPDPEPSWKIQFCRLHLAAKDMRWALEEIIHNINTYSREMIEHIARRALAEPAAEQKRG